MKVYVVALLVVVGILGGFYGGYKVGQNNVTASATGSTQASRTPGGFGGRGVGAACPSPGAPSPSPGTNAVARGTVSDLTSSSFTIALSACDVKVVFGNTVQVTKSTPGSTSDLKDNVTITVAGVRQADGSIKATVIQIGGGPITVTQPTPGGGG